jgi:hypothetical protein
MLALNAFTAYDIAGSIRQRALSLVVRRTPPLWRIDRIELQVHTGVIVHRGRLPNLHRCCADP